MKFTKRARYLALIPVFTATFFTAIYLFAFPGGAPPGSAGGLSSGTCMNAGCHTSLTPSNNSLTLSGIPAVYTPGQQYPVMIAMAPPSAGSGFGFQISSRSTSGGAQAGTLAGVSSGTGSNGTSGGVTYIGHTTPACSGASSCTFNVSWTAPPATAGTVQFDVASVSGFSSGVFAQKSVTTIPQAPPPPPQFAATNPVSPNTGSTAGGTMVTINGSNFVSGATVSFGSTAASTTFVSSTQLTAITPPASTAGPVSVRVQNPDLQFATLANGFTYAQATLPPPQFALTNPVSPNTGSTAGGTMVTINGSNFVSGATVSFGSTAAATTFVSSTQLTVVTPSASAAGPVSVRVQNPDGQFATLAIGFTYTQSSLPPPQFAAVNPVSPNTGSTAGGTMVTINGSNFVSGATVMFGSASASTTFNSSSQLSAVTPPASAAGPVNVRVQNPDGQFATLSGGFTYTQASGGTAPQFASSNPITPTKGSTDGETKVTISGSNFVNGAIVFFGAVPARDTKFISANQLQAETPESSKPGTVDVKVQNPDGQSAILPQSFTFTNNDDEGEDDEMEVGFGIGEEDGHNHSGGGGSGGEGGGDKAKAIQPGNLAGGGIFSFSQNNTLVTTVGTLASAPTNSFLMFVDTKRLNSLKGALPNNTGLAIINPSTSPANLTFTLLQIDGSPAAPPVSAQLAAGAHFQAFVTDSNLFGSRASDFSGTLRVDSTQPVSALTLQQINNQSPRNEALLTSTPVADMNQPASGGNLVFPQFVDGGGFQTRIMLLNTNNVAISGKILFVRDNASSPNDSDLHFDTSSGGGAEVPFRIQPQGQFSALSSGTGGFHLGFAMVVPDEGNLAPSGTAVLFFTPGEFTVATAGVAASASTNLGLLLVNSNPTSKGLAQDTGVAIANPSDTSAIDVVFTLRDGAGKVMATKSFSQLKGSLLAPRGHSSFFVNELFGSMASNFTGTMSIETSSPERVSAVTLLLTTNERNESLFTTLPVATPSSSSGIVFFPQLVSGKGYSMQIVLLNLSGAASSGSLNFFSGAESNNGSPLALRLNDTVSSSFTYTLPAEGVVIFKQK
jgi:hypothetical protein